MIAGEEGDVEKSTTTADSGIFLTNEDKLNKYFEKEYEFRPTKSQNITKGDYADGTLDKFVSRFISKYKQDRLQFIFGKKSKDISFEAAIQQFLGYIKDKESNITIIDS